MEHLRIKLSATMIVLLLAACDNDPLELPELNSELNEQEQSLVGTWQYTSPAIEVDRRSLLWADNRMEPSNCRNCVGGNRGDLFRRKIVYFDNFTYQLQWQERGDYTLGTEGDPNWQPSFGTWKIENNELIHNPNQPYEQRYSFLVTSKLFQRSHKRFMSVTYIIRDNFGNIIEIPWEREDEVQYREFFLRLD